MGFESCRAFKGPGLIASALAEKVHMQQRANSAADGSNVNRRDDVRGVIQSVHETAIDGEHQDDQGGISRGANLLDNSRY